ncbi:MAG: PBP1A family penicillin-binding protein [Gemmatimonadaceae bacterium]|nr:PBP1A family penicillin-binding protein [Gemmatimonadaceae bacterium]
MANRFARFRREHPTLVRALLLFVIFGAAFGLGLGYGAWALVCRGGQCPPVEALNDYTPRQTSKLYAADGRFIAELGLERRTLVRLDEIPLTVQQAFVITEDKRFYSHSGIDWRRVFGALARDILSRSWDEGFSTITMQLARNVFPERISREKTLVRKIKEGKVAREIEDKFDKKKILELYLNQINLGNGAYGVETASERYFGKSVRDLNIAEAATLAALPKAPERYNPKRHPDRAIQRRNTVIELMRRNGAISDADASGAKAFPLQLASKTDAGDTAPYFVEWIRQQLDAQFGRQLYEQGLRVYTTLDLDMQLAAERAVERQLRRIESGRFGKFNGETYEHYNARSIAGTEPGQNSPYLQGAFVALDPRNGAVRAMVGGRDFYDSKFNRATQALRQPGSSFKPIVYAAGVQNGRPPSYILADTAISVEQGTGTPWTPRNYDGKFLGPMPMRRGLYESRNIVAIQLGMELGENTVINEARNFGITTPIPPYPSIFIGSADVYPLEMIAAFAPFANLGIRAGPNAILRVENARQEVLWQQTPSRTTVLSPEESWIMVDMMKDVIRRGTASGSVWGAGFHLPAGGKTGTTNDGTNVWFIGYTADLVAGVWMGFDRPRKIMNDAQGGRLAAPAWTQFMTEVYRRKPAPPDWPRPASIITREIDVSTGLLQTPYCPRDLIRTEFYVPGTEPTRECDKHLGYTTPGYDTLGIGGPPPSYVPPPPVTGGSRVIPGAAPVPRKALPGDSLRGRFRLDTARSRGDSAPIGSVLPRRVNSFSHHRALKEKNGAG